MANEIAIAQRYLMPPAGSFWHWHDLGEAITWKGGGTIAFRVELVQILQRLGPERLPPLNSLLLVLAATRDSWREFPFEVGDSAPWAFAASDESDILNSLFMDPRGLAKLQQLDPALRSSVEAKVVLVEVIFDSLNPAATRDEAAIILQYLEHGIQEVLFGGSETSAATQPASRWTPEDLRRLRRGLDAVNPDSLRLRRRTGLDQMPRAAEVELSQAQQVRALLGELRDDNDLRGLAALARQLMATVSLPRAISDPDELQLGGVSDIANRGPLDRLLLTELVYDDLTLAVRVSVNEALYLRRESPPRTPERERILLLDAGLRSWGVPRVFATAVALALVATTDAHTRVAAYRAQGDAVVPVDLLSRDGLLDHLAALQPEIHPGDSLQAFADEFAGLERAAQPVIVTSEDVLADDAFGQALAKAGLPSFHLATVNRDGAFRMIEKNERGRKQIREARLDLSGLFADAVPRGGPGLVEVGRSTDLPAIFSTASFPLLLSHNASPDQMIPLGDRGVLAVAKDGRLMHWHRAEPIGALQLSDALPLGRLRWSRQETANETIFAILLEHSSQALHLLKVRLDQRTCEIISLGLEKTSQVMAIHGGALFVLQEKAILVLDLESGDLLGKSSLPDHVIWKQDRFFHGPGTDQWYAAAYDGQSTHLEPVFEHPERAPRLLWMCECEGVEGPIGITRVGEVYYTATGETWRVDYGPSAPARPTDFLNHGSCVVVLTANERTPLASFLLNVVTRTVSSFPPRDVVKALYPLAPRYVTQRHSRHRFLQIAVEASGGRPGRLVLTTRKQARTAIELTDSKIPSRRKIRLVPLDSGAVAPASARTFKPFAKISKPGITLSRAQWEDGSEAFLDNRGLLHLRSSDRKVPEITIVLTDGELGGWCSDGRLWGAKYYTGETIDPPIDEVIYQQAIAGFIRGIL